MNFPYKLKEPKAIFAFLKSKRYHLGQNVNNDWLLLIMVFIVFTIFAAYLSREAQSVLGGQGATLVAEVSSKKPDILDEEIMQTVVDFYTNRKATLETLMASPAAVSVIDPSL